MSSFDVTAFDAGAFDVEVTVPTPEPDPEDPPEVDPPPTPGEGHYIPVTTADTVIADTIEVML